MLLLERDDTAVDRTPPQVVSVVAPDPTTIVVTFSKAIEPASATNSVNYAVDGGIHVTAAALAEDARTVRLTTSHLTADKEYTLRLSALRDRAEKPNPLPPGAQVACTFRDPSRPLVVLDFAEGRGQTTANTGATADTHPLGSLTPSWPRWVTDALAPAGGGALDFGTLPGDYAVDLGTDAPERLRGLQSFTLTGWVNCRSLQVGSGGNRLIHSQESG